VKSSSHTVVAYLRSLVARHGAADDDCELLRRFDEARDGDAFAVLMQRHGPMVLSLARRIVGDEQLAEDVFQAAFLLLARKIHTIRRRESLPCWLHGVARRLSLQARRARRRRHERETRIRPSSPPTPLDDLTVREFLAVLDEELHQLPENYRAPLILCCLEGRSREEAAKRLGCSPDALKGRLERGRDRLRMRLEKRGLTLPAAVGGTLLLAGATSPVPAALSQATLQAATSGNGITPAVALLIQETMRNMVINKLKALGAVVVLLALAGTGVGMMALHPQVGKETMPTAARDKPLSAEKHVDLYGDPLPEDAVMRLGTLQRRAVGMKLAVTADGKSIIGTRNLPRNSLLSIWDAATGELCQKRELPEYLRVHLLSPDGQWLIAPSGWDELGIWDVGTLKKVRVLKAEGRRRFDSIAISRDCKRVAAVGSQEDKKGGYDHRICIWEMVEGKEIFRTEIHKNHPFSQLALSPDGKRLLGMFISNSSDSGLYCWDIVAGRQAWINEKIRSPLSVIFTADGKIVTSPSGQIVDLVTGQTVKLENPPPITTKLKGGGIASHAGMQLTLTPDDRTLLIPKPNGNGLIVWDTIHGKELRTLQVEADEVVAMPDGKSIITNDGSLQRWDLETGKPLWQDTFALGHIGKINAMAFSADGKRLASCSADGSVRLWDSTTGRPLRVWRAYSPLAGWGLPKILDITPDGRWILSVGLVGPIKLWDASSEKGVRSIALPPNDRGNDYRDSLQLRIRADGSQAVALIADFTEPPSHHRLATWDLKTVQMLTCHTFEQSNPQLCALSPDGSLLLRNGDLVDTASGQKLAQMEGPPTLPCVFSRDGALVLGGTELPENRTGFPSRIQTTGHLCVWESVTGKTVAHVKASMRTDQVAFHPNNRLLAAIDDRFDTDGGIHLYDVVTNKLLAVRRMPKDVPRGRMSDQIIFDFSPDGRRLATGMPDGTILLWDVSLPPSQPQHLRAKEIESLWTALADADAAKAWRAVWRLADARDDALALLRGRVKPCPTAAADLMRKLLADLDSDSFDVREAALKRLRELGPEAEPALRAALKSKPSLELRRRIEALLTAAPSPPTSEELRQLRALIVLERIGTVEAKRLLEETAQGPPSARLTRQARAALTCLP